MNYNFDSYYCSVAPTNSGNMIIQKSYDFLTWAFHPSILECNNTNNYEQRLCRSPNYLVFMKLYFNLICSAALAVLMNTLFIFIWSPRETRMHKSNYDDTNSALTRRFNSVSDVPLHSKVLCKVASLTLAEQQNSHAISKAILAPKVLDKLDFCIFEKFEGQMLINWLVSYFHEGYYLKETLSAQDMKLLGAQFCTLLLAAGVLKKLEENETTSLRCIFRPDLMYFGVWSHSESPSISCHIPGTIRILAPRTERHDGWTTTKWGQIHRSR